MWSQLCLSTKKNSKVLQGLLWNQLVNFSSEEKLIFLYGSIGLPKTWEYILTRPRSNTHTQVENCKWTRLKMPSPESNSKLITHKPYHMLPCIYLQCRAYVNSSNNETSLPQQAMPLFFISYAKPTKDSMSSTSCITLCTGLLQNSLSTITSLHNLQGAFYSPSKLLMDFTLLLLCSSK